MGYLLDRRGEGDYLGHGEVEQGSMIGLAMLTKVRGKGEVDRSRTTMDQYETRLVIVSLVPATTANVISKHRSSE
jgi:hypothetical protein